ncbi:MAG: ABC-F family ATP-binding cassette domain-containing protein [Lachnospiraceae bacterium]|nr:ABC-F family ATP-binding cassette domain-containing protein [Lachnospiraceae bacterium]
MRYEIRHALVKYAADTIIEDVNFEIHDTEKVAVVGRNGCGKTTLLKLIAGEITMANLDSDEECGIFMAGKQNIGFLKQISFPDGEISVEEEIKKAFAPVFECEKQMKETEEKLTLGEDKALLSRYSFLQNQMEALRGYTWRRDMEVMFQKFGFALEDLQRPIGTFSGGQQTKVAFMKLLLSRPDIMLLDEPTNHLDMPTIEWLEDYLKSYDRAVVIVSHDRMFLDKVSDVTYEIEYHQIKRYKGNYSAFMRLKEEALIKQEKDYELQQKEIQRLTEWIEKWKNTPTKVAATRSKRMAIEHMVKIPKPRRFDTKSFRAMFTPNKESYTDVLWAKNLDIGYDGEVLSRVNLKLKKKQRMAILGENGKGKSTLLKTLVGVVPAISGTYGFGMNVEWGYFDQQEAVTAKVDPNQTVLDHFWEVYPDLDRESVRSALGSFLFSGEDVMKLMGQLSGGEKVRLALCKMFQLKPNLLILDEPTNHMDIVGKDALEKMLTAYEGTVLFVSHDRYFISQVATDILEFAGGEVHQYSCGYEEYVEQVARIKRGEIGRPGSGTIGGKAGEKTSAPSAGVSQAAGANQGVRDGQPTLTDVFDKKTYYNPGKMKSRLTKQLEKYEQMLKESEEKMAQLQLQLLDPALASDYGKLMEIQEAIDKEEHQQETLLERMLEAETELEELSNA